MRAKRAKKIRQACEAFSRETGIAKRANFSLQKFYRRTKRRWTEARQMPSQHEMLYLAAKR